MEENENRAPEQPEQPQAPMSDAQIEEMKTMLSNLESEQKKILEQLQAANAAPDQNGPQPDWNGFFFEYRK